ncbi:hypothetical protein M9H77_31878 [Catharanthus roseus]|uniref:Uncharacterized protein n=1 Tax=Catharanthus roseus TaxID=4058 RepID=A0ACC0A575_CATRO|nr:hypothetical protein M9H77_31878 [Catharanthus roseus]
MDNAKTKRKSQWKFLWFCIFCQLIFPAANAAQPIPQKSEYQPLNSSSSQLKLINQENGHVMMYNGLLNVTFSSPGGMVTGIEYKGIDNLLDFHQKESRRGYWDVVSDKPGKPGTFESIQGTTFKIIAQDEDKIEISFKKNYDPSLDSNNTDLPLNIDKRFIILQGHSGFYCYAIFERLNGWPELHIGQLRMAFKLQKQLFNYMAVSDTIQRLMPSSYDREQGHILDYKEAVLLINPKDSRFKGEVDDKYQYSRDNKDSHLHGWICQEPGVGFWMITPSDEFRTGGPFKQDLTSHVGPNALAMFYSNHYTGETLNGLDFLTGEPWKKVFGPVFIYLNSGSGNGEELQEALWKDAKNQTEIETKKWPYDFPVSDEFPHADQRGSVSGRLLINDSYINQSQFPAKTAYIGLAPTGDEGSWQLDAKGYQFWNQTDEDGYFNITGIRQGNYSLLAWIPGIFGDYKYQVEMDIRPGSEYSLGNLVFTPPRNGPTLWEIGIPDRTAAEFYVPDPVPGLRNYLFDNHTDKWRQYGLWNQYTELYPDQDLVYTVGISNYSKDWFFAHLNRRISDKEYVPTTWLIQFDLRNVIPFKTYTFRLALASANYAHLQIRVNRENSPHPHFTTGGIGRDNAIARHGIHGLYWPFSYSIPWYMLVQGRNTIFLKQAQAGGSFDGLMYDYLRLEGPA